MKSPVLSLYYLLLAIFLFAGCPIEQLMAQMNTDTTRYITIEGLVRDQNDRKRLEFVHVTVPGTPIGTVTNSEGVFSIKILAGIAYPLHPCRVSELPDSD